MNNKANKTSFQKGHGRLRTDESYIKAGKKISITKKGKKRQPLTIMQKERLSKILKGRKITWNEKLRGKDYGLTTAQKYLKKLEMKAGRVRPKTCEVCFREGRIYFDHNHLTGKFRGWLCVKCNNTLGLVNDDIRILNSLAEYAKKHFN